MDAIAVPLPTLAFAWDSKQAEGFAPDCPDAAGRTFEKRSVPLRTGGTKIFNAVADDGSVVATIINASGTTSGGKKPIGKIRGAVADLYFLTLAQARTRQLVITNPEFYSIFLRDLEGAVDPGVSVVHVSLPAELAARVAAVTHAASQEMTFE